MPKPNRQKRQRGVPQLRLEDNGRWYAFWSEGGRSKRQSLGTADEDQAVARFALWLQQGGGQPVADVAQQHTIASLWEVYERKHVNAGGVADTGKATIGYAWANLRQHFGDMALPEFNQASVDAYTAARLAGRIGRPAKSITARREIATLIAALNFCARPVGGKIIDKADIEEIKLPEASPPRDRWLRMDEMQRLFDAAAEARRGDRLSRVERFLWLALFTAARKTAILELTWDRVDFETNTIHYSVPGRRQTKKRRADVTIATQLRPVLERAFKERTGPLVLDHSADDVWASMQYVAIRAGFSDQKVARGASPKSTGITPHVLRHTAATHMARRGVPLWTIAQVLGNTTQMIEKVYAKWQPSNAAGTVDLISNIAMEAAE